MCMFIDGPMSEESRDPQQNLGAYMPPGPWESQTLN